MSQINDLAGRQFGRLTVVGFAGVVGRGARWRCLCVCGAELVVRSSALVTGNTKSCGCQRRDVSRARSRDALKLAQAACITHGRSKTPLERTLHRMRQRCLNPNNPDFRHYGGRGIAICAAWLADPAAFFAWAEVNGYAPGLTIERKDVNRHYEPSNCRWAPAAEQPRNTRRSRWITWRGETAILEDWQRRLGTRKDEIGRRLRAGEAAEAVLDEIAARSAA